MRAICNTVKCVSIQAIQVPRRKERENGGKAIHENTMSGFQKWVEDMNTQTQKGQQTRAV